MELSEEALKKLYTPPPRPKEPRCSSPPGGHLHAIGAVTLPKFLCSERYAVLVECGGQQLLFTRNNLFLHIFETLVRTRPSADANFSESSLAVNSHMMMSHNTAFLCLPDGVTVAAYGGMGNDRGAGIRVILADASKLPLKWSFPVVAVSGSKEKTGCVEKRDAAGGGSDMCEFDGKLSVVAFAGRVFLYARFNLAPKGGARHVGVISSVDGRQQWGRFQSIRVEGYNAGPAANNIYYFNVQHAKEANLLVAFYPASIEGRGCVYRSTSSNGVDFTAPECLMPSTLHADWRTREHPLDALLPPGAHVGGGAGNPSAHHVFIEHDIDIRINHFTDFHNQDCTSPPYICEYAMRRWPPSSSDGRGESSRGESSRGESSRGESSRGESSHKPTFSPTLPAPSVDEIAERTRILMQQQHVGLEQWELYVLKLYRAKRAELPSLPQMGEVDLIYETQLRLHNVGGAGGFVGTYHCEKQPLVPFTPRAPHSPLVAWFLKPAPFAAIPAHTWTEVTHCGGSKMEAKAAWFYLARGSGIYVNTGKTIAFDCHQDAVKFFLGKPCSCARRSRTEANPCEGEDEGNATQCDVELPQLLPDAAEAAGYDSIQFVRHCDICAVPTLQCGHEIMMVKATDGGDACPKNVDFRSGLGGRDRCHCVPSRSTKSIRGTCASCAGSDL